MLFYSQSALLSYYLEGESSEDNDLYVIKATLRTVGDVNDQVRSPCEQIMGYTKWFLLQTHGAT